MSNNGCGCFSMRECEIDFCDISWLKIIPFLPYFDGDKLLENVVNDMKNKHYLF